MKFHNFLAVLSLCLLFGQSAIAQNSELCVPATISVREGDTTITCAPGAPDWVRFQTSRVNTPYGFIVTDTVGTILLVSQSDKISFRGLPGGELRVYAFSYLGNVLATVGENVFTDELASVCAQLSFNFVTIDNIVPNGGTPTTLSGLTTIHICTEDDIPDVIQFTTDVEEIAYTFLLTNEGNELLDTNADGIFDFTNASAGTCRVWGLSYTGDLLAQQGEDIIMTQLAEGCFDLSDTFTQVIRTLPQGDSVFLADRQLQFARCDTDEAGDTSLTFINDNEQTFNYAYLLVNGADEIISVLAADQLSFKSLPAGFSYVRGLSYAGELLASAGQPLVDTQLASGCFDLSDNAISLERIYVDGGQISLDDGQLETVVCGTDETPELFSLSTNSQAGLVDYAWVVTGQDDRILGIFTELPVDLTAFRNETVFQIRGLSYQGNIQFELGTPLSEAVLVNGCAELSDNSVQITVLRPDGAIIAVNGDTSAAACDSPDAAAQNLVLSTSNEQDFAYAYFILDDQNTILQIVESDQVLVQSLPAGFSFARGISYDGVLTATPGQNLLAIDPVNGCYDLSDNTVSLERIFVDGGQISLDDDHSETVVCGTDAIPEVFSFITNSQADLVDYAWVVTGRDDRILGIFTELPVDLTPFQDETAFQVRGLSYQGSLLPETGTPLSEAVLVNGCYHLSDNSVQINVLRPDGATISVEGAAGASICDSPDASKENLVFSNSSDQDLEYAYFIVDAQNTILQLVEGDQLIVQSLPEGLSYVRGISYAGILTAMPGENLLAIDPVDGCYDLSDNTLTLERIFVDGGQVSLPDGSTEARPCGIDNVADTFILEHNSTATNSYAWILTDGEGIIKTIYTELPVKLDDFTDVDNFRVYGLSYLGGLLPANDLHIEDAVLVNGCYHISENFVSLTRIKPEGGTIALAGGATSFSGCDSPDAQPLLLSLTNDQDDSFSYGYLMLDMEGNILQVITGSTVALSEFPAGASLLRGFSYEGEIVAQVGEDPAMIDPVSGCYDLSDNVIEINKTFVDGGEVSILNDGTFALVCGNDDVSDAFTFTSTTTATNHPYALIVTDEDNRIFAAVNGGVIDFDLFAAGTYRVWGVSYTGNLNAPFGGVLTALAVSDDCFDLSSNFVTIRQEEVNGGQLLLHNGSTTAATCPGDGNPDIISYLNNGSSSAQYIYVITDAENRILTTTTEDSFDFETAGTGNCRIWGLAYSGTLQAEQGLKIDEAALSDGCFSLSSNFLTIVRSVPDAGTVALPDGSNTAVTCPGDGQADIVEFRANTSFAGPYLFIITDNEGNILDFSVTGRYDFDFAPAGDCRVYGVAYTGTPQIPENVHIATAILSDDCYDVSDNFIKVIRQAPEAGRVSLRPGGRKFFACPGNGTPDIARYRNNSFFPGNYLYIITDDNNNIITSTTAEEFNFEPVELGICRIWGMAYTGTATIVPGENLADAILSDDCFDLSDTYITVVRVLPEAGTISTLRGDTVQLCVGDFLPDVINFTRSGVSPAKYARLITDEQGRLLTITDMQMVDFNNAGGGNCRIYGVSYTGELIIQPGEDVTTTPLSDDCYDLSDNFVYLDRLSVDGDTISTGSGATDVEFICSGDGQADVIQFFTNANTDDADYRYLLTDGANNIIGPVVNDMVNLENTPFQQLRVWGVAYTGEFNLSIGQDITMAMLSDSCYDVSDNFIQLISGTAEGGSISTASGSDTTRVCIGGPTNILDVITTSTAAVGYVYLITTTDSLLVDIVESGAIDFGVYEAGNYLVWGLSFTGQITAVPGDAVTTTQLASSCFELAEKPIFVERTPEIDGGTIDSAFGDPLFVCLNDNQADLGAFTTTSASPTYRYIITDTLNNIVIPNIIGNVLDFDRADPGVSRVYGVAYSGEFTASVGDNVLEDILSDECSALSSNYITIIKKEFKGGTVLTETGETEVTVEVGDGMSDIVRFDSLDTSGDQYVYLITDDQDMILGVVNGDSHDFEGAGLGSCRVWGLAYSGELLAMAGDDLSAAMLSDRCYRLSENFITVQRVEPGQNRQNVHAAEAAAQPVQGLRMQISPNPASRIVSIAVDELGEPSLSPRRVTIEIFGATGRRHLLEQQELSVGTLKLEMDVSSLRPGIYIIRASDGRSRTQLRFVKQ